MTPDTKPKARVWLIEDGEKQRIWPIENDKIFIEYKGEPPRNPIRVIAIDDIRPLVEALDKLFFATQNEMIVRNLPLEWQKDSAMGLAETVLASLPSELLASEGSE